MAPPATWQQPVRQQVARFARTNAARLARAQLVESVDGTEDAEPTTQTVTFSLVASAELALAEEDARRAAMALGAADGLRQRVGLRAWPSMRPGEAELAARVAQEIGANVFKDAFAAGSELSQREAVALVRGDSLN